MQRRVLLGLAAMLAGCEQTSQVARAVPPAVPLPPPRYTAEELRAMPPEPRPGRVP